MAFCQGYTVRTRGLFRTYANYYQTYIELDVRQLIELKDVSLFENFIKLLAGRAGLLHLLQLSIEELTQSGLTLDGFED
jgi:hypothetical protein